ncbi:MAG TPA: HD domain-containing phosphohydrolase [Anaerolineales bacterium]|nr:HD domain-containing phosphohydrolase [Anaerolineales bacterium]
MNNQFTARPADSLLESILKSSADLVVILDARGNILDYKLTAPHLAEKFSGEFHYQRIGELLPSRNHPGGLKEFYQSGHTLPFEFSLTTFDGQKFWFDGRLTCLSPSQQILFSRDITKYKQSELRMRQQSQRMTGLRSIDLAIASNLDLNLLLPLLLEQANTLLPADASTLLLMNSETNLLTLAASSGFRSNTHPSVFLKLGTGYAGQVALERKRIHYPNITGNAQGGDLPSYLQGEKFVSYMGSPLITKGRILGVLEVFHSSILNPDAPWLEFLDILAGRGAIAIDNAILFENLQKSNAELGMAYDSTIEGWLRTLDFRDRETEGRTRRVADMTVQLALALGVAKEELIHIRRGAILHDIGKVAIPDDILLKPGPLTEDEWNIMRKHPVVAVELLTPINYLSPALDIPHWHHERWDGTGYPDNLKGEQIPFSARVFSIADVYDVLISERPYRNAWTKQKAIEYIKEQTGKLFDPGIVPEFLKLVHSNEFSPADWRS